MARFGDEDRALFLDDFGLSVRYGNKRTWGILDEEERLENDETGGQVLVIETVLLVNTADFRAGGKLYGLTVKSSIEVDDVDYTVHDKRLQADGGFTQLVVARS